MHKRSKKELFAAVCTYIEGKRASSRIKEEKADNIYACTIVILYEAIRRELNFINFKSASILFTNYGTSLSISSMTRPSNEPVATSSFRSFLSWISNFLSSF